MKKLFTLMCTLMVLQSFAQIKMDSSFTLSGSIDTYFRTNLNSTNTPDSGFVAPGTSFANLPGFSLGMFNLVANYEGKKTGFTADLVFGPRGADAVFLSEGSANIVNQLFAYWQVNKKVKLTLGNFNTFLGYEVISPTANFNYSTTYMFSNGPFSHTGLKADIDFGKGFTGVVGVFNPTDLTDFNLTGDYVGGLQLGYSVDKGSSYLNVLVSDDFYQIDLTTGYQVTDQVYLGLNATTAKDAFNGAALYAQYATSDDFAIGVRGEYFKFEGSDTDIFDLTLSANYKIGNLTLIPEIRLDAFSEDVVIPDYSKPMENQSSLASFVLAAVYGF